MIILTDKAISKVKEIIEEEGLSGSFLRVKIIGGGCGGFIHDLYFVDDTHSMDEVFEYDGFKIITDPISYQYLDGTTVDYIDTLYNAGFKFENPNIKATCGCKQSFSF